jgi:hypothetical protein
VRRRRLAALLVLSAAVVATLELAVGPASERVRHGAELSEITIKAARLAAACRWMSWSPRAPAMAGLGRCSSSSTDAETTASAG